MKEKLTSCDRHSPGYVTHASALWNQAYSVHLPAQICDTAHVQNTNREKEELFSLSWVPAHRASACPIWNLSCLQRLPEAVLMVSSLRDLHCMYSLTEVR